MKNFTKNLMIVSFILTGFSLGACTKTEKTTVIKEETPPQDGDDVKLKIKTEGVDVEVHGDQH